MAIKPVEEVLTTYEAQSHWRFIKTHTPLDGIPYFENVTYLFVARDPRDAFVSMGNHRKNMRPEAIAKLINSAQQRNVPVQPPPPPDVRELFREWITTSGIPEDGAPTEFNVLHHADTFWQFRDLPNIHLFHYNDMKADLDGQMRRISAALGIPVNEAIWPQLAAAGFAEMKSNAETLAPTIGAGDEWQAKSSFFNSGKTGQWRDVLGDGELALYREAMTTRLEPELARWLEQGWGNHHA